MANIKDISIYGNKKKPEDRVTDALLQILSFGGHELVSYVIDEIELPSNEVCIDSQYSTKESDSIPDGRISVDCKYTIIVESKLGEFGTTAGNHDQEQLHKHILLCKDDTHHLLYITNDTKRPEMLGATICWMNWDQIVQKLKEYDKQSELLQFLINQFVKLVEFYVVNKLHSLHNQKRDDTSFIPDDGIDENDRVIIVGGRWGEQVAKEYNFYACQNNRSFKPARYIAFYCQKRIKYLFMILGEPEDEFDFRNKKEVVDSGYFEGLGKDDSRGKCKFFRLKFVKEFEGEGIIHKTNSAYVQRQRYTSFNRMINAKSTEYL